MSDMNTLRQRAIDTAHSLRVQFDNEYHNFDTMIEAAQLLEQFAGAAAPQDERALFESSAKSDSSGVSFERDAGGNYIDMSAAILWRGWELARAALPAQAVAPAIPWDNFPGYLIDHCEGDTITEEYLQGALAAMLADPKYSAAPVQAVAPSNSLQEARRQRLAEAVAIILHEEPDNALADCVRLVHGPGDNDEEWDEQALRAKFGVGTAPQAGVQDDLAAGVQSIVTLLEAREWADLLPHQNALVLRLWDAVNELVSSHNDAVAPAAPQAVPVAWRASDADALEWAGRHNVENTLKDPGAARCAIDDARSLHKLAAQPAAQPTDALANELQRLEAEIAQLRNYMQDKAARRRRNESSTDL